MLVGAVAGRVLARWRQLAGGRRGSSPLLESSLTLPLMLAFVLGIVQVTLLLHADRVVTHAAFDGARVAATGDLTQGEARTASVIASALGSLADVVVTASETDGVATVEVSGDYELFVPMIATITVPLRAEARVAAQGLGP